MEQTDGGSQQPQPRPETPVEGGASPARTLPVFDSVSNYEKVHRIGEGTYGVVYKARDRTTGEVVALKRVRFDRSRDGVPVTSIRELRVLETCKHPNIVALKKVVTGPQADAVFLVFEYCEHDLGRLLDSLPRPFSVPEVKCLMRQLLTAVAYLHDHWVVHRDIKLSNLLYTNNGTLKLCDFGLARYYQPYVSAMTPNVVTLWYRAPEVLLGSEAYDEAIDCWSCGAIFAELLSGEPLFPAHSELECLRMMCGLLGSPTPRIWPGMASLPSAGRFSLPDQPFNFLRKHLPSLSDQGVHLLNSLLTYDPEKRITARQALRHPFFQERPYPLHELDMPSFPTSHLNPHVSAKGHHQQAGGSHGQQQQQPAKHAGAKRTWHDQVQQLQDSKRQREMDQRFGNAFGGGSVQLGGTGVQVVRQR